MLFSKVSERGPTNGKRYRRVVFNIKMFSIVEKTVFQNKKYLRRFCFVYQVKRKTSGGMPVNLEILVTYSCKQFTVSLGENFDQ